LHRKKFDNSHKLTAFITKNPPKTNYDMMLNEKKKLL